MMCYLVWGMILMTTMFSVVSAYLRMIHYLGRQLRGARDVHVWFGGKSMKVSKLLEIVAAEFNIHYLGRQLRGARDVHVWFGGKSMKISKLLEIVAAEFNATPRQLKGVLRDLDGLITAAVGENQLLSRRPSSLFKSRRSSKKRIGYSLQEGLPAEGRKQRYNFLKTMDYRQNEQPIKEETIMVNKSFFKERQAIDRTQSVDLGELNRRTIIKYEI
uniref:Ribosome biogenesis protein RPF2 homolog n=1 Tax=Ascaris lumbricoides TaxID=6252 RepID=A0A0M3IBX5_ASCLU